MRTRLLLTLLVAWLGACAAGPEDAQPDSAAPPSSPRRAPSGPGEGPGTAIVVTPPTTPDGAVVVRGLDEATLARLRTTAPGDAEARSLIAVRVADDADAADAPAMLGSHEVTGDVVRFKPRFPLQRGLKYRVDVRSVAPAADGDGAATRTFVIADPTQAAPPTRVTTVYPSGDVLPENLLRLYLHFSAPMSRGDSYRHIQLLDETARPIDLPFLELPEELWNPEGTRLTLLLDPGRVKQGLKPREDEGPILVAGKRYTLAVSKSWRDAHGRPLAAAFGKSFAAGAADTTQPDPGRWSIATPAAGSRAPLVVTCGEPLDHGLMQHMIRVTRGGAAVEGSVDVADGETRWSFTPAKPWSPGRHALVIATTLEDRAGNSVGRAFEVDLNAPATAAAPATVQLPFDVAPTSE